MAEAIFNDLAQKRGIHARASSAGCAAADGAPLSTGAEGALREKGIRSSHTTRCVNSQILRAADMVFCLTEAHAKMLMRQYPEMMSKIYVFPTEIDDPYGQSPSVYRACLLQIEKGVSEILDILERTDTNAGS